MCQQSSSSLALLHLPIGTTLNNTRWREHKYSSHFQIEYYKILKHIKIFNKEIQTFGITILKDMGREITCGRIRK